MSANLYPLTIDCRSLGCSLQCCPFRSTKSRGHNPWARVLWVNKKTAKSATEIACTYRSCPMTFVRSGKCNEVGAPVFLPKVQRPRGAARKGQENVATETPPTSFQPPQHGKFDPPTGGFEQPKPWDPTKGHDEDDCAPT